MGSLIDGDPIPAVDESRNSAGRPGVGFQRRRAAAVAGRWLDGAALERKSWDRSEIVQRSYGTD